VKLAFFENINLNSVFKRFPLPVLTSIIIGIISLLLLEGLVVKNTESYRLVSKFLHVLILFFACFSLISILKLKNAFVQQYELHLIIATIFSGLVYYFLLPHYPLQKHAIQTLGLFVVLHLLITVLPFAKDNDLKEYWAYNKTLLLRFLESSIYTVFIFVSLSVAIVALDKLFGVSFNKFEIYGDLWIVLLSCFHPIYFFSRFPTDLSFDNKELESSFAFKVFARRILIPIVLLYALILFAYILKIIGQWSWPRGWVSNMVLWFSVFGILAFLLNYIRLDEKEPGYVRVFKRYYFYFQALMSIVLLLAVYKRISEYGVTEPRYIVAILGVWLLIMSSYFIISKRDNIKWIPSSLAAFILIATIGPFNMHSSTIRSQFNRLKKDLREANILNDGVLKPATDLSKEMIQKLSHKMWVLDERNALHKLKQFDVSAITFPPDTSFTKKAMTPLHFRGRSNSGTTSEVYGYATALGIPYDFKSRYQTTNNRFSLYSKKTIETPINGFDQLVQLRVFKQNKLETSSFSLSDDQQNLVYMDSTGVKRVVPLQGLIDNYAAFIKTGERVESIEFESKAGGFLFRFFLQNVNGTQTDNQYQFENLDGFVLIKKQEL